LTQELKATDHEQRQKFTDWLLAKNEFDNDFSRKIIFSDEAHLNINGYVSRQNCSIWGSENPREFQEKPMHPQRVTVWCFLWAEGVTGPYFFENEDGKAITVTGEPYRTMINNFLWPALINIDMKTLWFQQDRASCHAAKETVNMLR